MADVFISYSKSHTTVTRELAHEFEAKGLTVWWDTDLLAGETFRDRIIEMQGGDRYLDAAVCKISICNIGGGARASIQQISPAADLRR